MRSAQIVLFIKKKRPNSNNKRTLEKRITSWAWAALPELHVIRDNREMLLGIFPCSWKFINWTWRKKSHEKVLANAILSFMTKAEEEMKYGAAKDFNLWGKKKVQRRSRSHGAPRRHLSPCLSLSSTRKTSSIGENNFSPSLGSLDVKLNIGLNHRKA